MLVLRSCVPATLSFGVLLWQQERDQEPRNLADARYALAAPYQLVPIPQKSSLLHWVGSFLMSSNEIISEANTPQVFGRPCVE